LRLDLAQFRSLAAFAQFGSNLDKSTQQQLDRGMRLTELLKQPQYQPLSLSDQVAVLYAGTRGYIDHVPVERVKEWQNAFLRAFNTQFAALAGELAEKAAVTDEIENGLKDALTTFNASWS
jgi:F-type H+-transporting ATPase subunit alpha